MHIGRAEYDLKVVSIDGLEAGRLKEEEGVEVWLHVEEPGWQAVV